MATKKVVTKVTEKTQQFESMNDALDFIDSLKRKRKIEGNLNAIWSVRWKETVKKTSTS